MKKQQTLALLISSLSIASALAYPEESSVLEQRTCSIELSKLKSPDAYLVALVEYTGDAKCDEKVCAKKFAVIEVLAAGQRSSELRYIHIGSSAEHRTSPPPGHRSVGVYIPSSNPKIYLWLSEAHMPQSLESKTVEEYKQAVELAKPSEGAPHCKKTS